MSADGGNTKGRGIARFLPHALLVLVGLGAVLYVTGREKPVVPPVPVPAGTAYADAATRVLFVGNSYTAGSQRAINTLIAQHPELKIHASYITPGGRRLVEHMADAATRARISDQDWDFVVLQEQSQMPSFPSEPDVFVHFTNGARDLSQLVQASGATPVFFMTWGRRDGDSMNPEISPDYSTMQGLLATSYRDAARQNDAALAPVGDAWQYLHDHDPERWRGLYVADGSHPSALGGYLNALVLVETLFGIGPDQHERPAEITPADWQAIVATANKAMATETPAE